MWVTAGMKYRYYENHFFVLIYSKYYQIRKYLRVGLSEISLFFIDQRIALYKRYLFVDLIFKLIA
ncbi:MAG: hypothetical protein BGO48_05015 [Mucilaginibacter sp. 44-25]|nr:MAG: hypothetical protein BGO48_05015 [Mucilaginibacter sp. 44-25]